MRYRKEDRGTDDRTFGPETGQTLQYELSEEQLLEYRIEDKKEYYIEPRGPEEPLG